MSGCFPSECNCLCHVMGYVGECTCNCKNNFTTYVHTDVNNPCYKNHELVMKRIDELEKLHQEIKTFLFGHKLGDKSFVNQVKDLEEVVHCFKQDFESFIDENQGKMQIKVEKLEGMVQFIRALVNAKICADSKDNKPHTCPVCDGMKKFKVFGKDKEADCPACEGKGIVWD